MVSTFNVHLNRVQICKIFKLTSQSLYKQVSLQSHTLHNACLRTITDPLSQTSTAVYRAVQSYIDTPFLTAIFSCQSLFTGCLPSGPLHIHQAEQNQSFIICLAPSRHVFLGYLLCLIPATSVIKAKWQMKYYDNPTNGLGEPSIKVALATLAQHLIKACFQIP